MGFNFMKTLLMSEEFLNESNDMEHKEMPFAQMCTNVLLMDRLITSWRRITLGFFNSAATKET